MTPRRQTFEFKQEKFTHKYHPVRWSYDKKVYAPGGLREDAWLKAYPSPDFPKDEEKGALTKIDTKLTISEPLESLGKWYQSRICVKFDLDETGSQGDYVFEIGLRGISNEDDCPCKSVEKSLADAFPDQCASLEMTIHTERDHNEGIFLSANEIFNSLAMETAMRAIEKSKKMYKGGGK